MFLINIRQCFLEYMERERGFKRLRPVGIERKLRLLSVILSYHVLHITTKHQIQQCHTSLNINTFQP